MTGVKTAYTTRGLAELLDITERSVQRRARRESWLSRPREGRGGGHEWLLTSMPEATRQAVARAAAARLAREKGIAPPRILPEVFTVNTLTEVPENKRLRATARALLVEMAGEYFASSGSHRTEAYEIFCAEYNRGAIPAPGWARELLPRLCRSSLMNWERAIGAGGVVALTGKHGLKRKGSGIIDTTSGMADVVAAHILDCYKVAAEDVLDSLKVTHAGQPLPSLRNVQRWMQQYRATHPKDILLEQNPDGYKSQYQAAFGSRSENITRINQLWELDSSPADIMLADGKRYTLIGGIDVATRRTRLKLARTSSSQGVCSLLHKMLIAFGVPETVKIDNGADYASARVSTALLDLRVHVDFCRPFAPEEKPHIERFFGTFQRRLKTLPDFIGHSVADRKAIESRKSFAERVSRKDKEKTREKPVLELSYKPEEFQAYCDSWCQNTYGERKHGGLGMSPNEAAAAAAAAGYTMRIAKERALDILLMPAPANKGRRRVNKDGIHVEGGTYIATALGGRIGETVLVRMDTDDSGYIYVFDLEGIFICLAEDPDLTGASKAEIAMMAKAMEKEVKAKIARETKRVIAKVKPRELAPLIAEYKHREGEANRAERALRYGAERSLEYSTPALEQAKIAARFDGTPGSALSEREREALSARAKEILTEPAKWKIPASDAEKFVECRRLEAIELAGCEANFEALNWMRAWKNSLAYKNFEMVRVAGEKARNKTHKGELCRQN